MRRLALVLSVIAALLLTAALAVPALGGPSIGQIAKTAAKALKLRPPATATGMELLVAVPSPSWP